MEKNHHESNQRSAQTTSSADTINESRNENDIEGKYEEERGKAEEPSKVNFVSDYKKGSEEMDRFLDAISKVKISGDPHANLPDIPKTVEKIVKLVEGEITKFDCSKDQGKWSTDFNEDSTARIEAINKVSILGNALASYTSDPKYLSVIKHMNNVIQRTMLFLEEEFRLLLEDSRIEDSSGDDQKIKKASFKSLNHHEESQVIDVCSEAETNFTGLMSDTILRLKAVAKAMMIGGYETECCQVFSITRRNTFEECLTKAGFRKISVEDVQKMQWESLECEIANWIKACRLCISSYFQGEKNLCEAVFNDHPSISASLFGNLVRGVIIQLLNFAEAVATTKRSAERLFKFLDIYETLGDLIQSMDKLFPGESSPEIKTETISARCRTGEAAVSIFSDLENSIKADSGKTPVPGGAVHPLTRYVMNYLKYACEYRETLEQAFQDHQKLEKSDTIKELDNEGKTTDSSEMKKSPFVVQLLVVMGLLDSNLDAKAKLYKDPSLSNIFLMNNGRYIMQKVKGSAEIHDLLGNAWRRKRSSDLRQYHKNYQRETWSKVLACLRDEGLQQGKGGVMKPLLKERFKTFNSMIDEIHKTQSAWVVSDEQLQSELRVSISAVVIPAYRSFLGRFKHYFDGGRQSERYIKYGPEELEASIDELFDGTRASMLKRRS